MHNDKETPTLGEQRVRATHNPSDVSMVDIIKQKTAELIDLMQALKNEVESTTYKPEQSEVQSERLRLISLSQTSYEEAAMWGVKAATS